MSDVIAGLISGGIQGIGQYMASREDRKVKERQMAIDLALKQRQQQLDAVQSTANMQNAAYNNIMGAAERSLRY